MDSALLMPLMSILMNKDGSLFFNMLIFLFHFIATYHRELKKLLKHYTPTFTKNMTYTLQAKLTYKHNNIYDQDFPDNFLAVCNYIKKSVANMPEKMNYEIIQVPTSYKDKISFINLRSRYKLIDNIYVKTDIKRETGEKTEFTYVTLELILQTDKNSFTIIENFLQECLVSFNTEKIDNLKTQHVFIFEKVDKDNDHIFYQEFPFETTKEFNNLFFDDKSNVIQMIDYFLNNHEEYKRIGMPYTLGFLLTGLPGTGKTSFIKCLAKYTKRHIVVLPTKKIRNIDTLKNIFMKDDINYTRIPNNKRIYVFEDIDCGEWSDIVMSRSLKREMPCKNDNNSETGKILESVITQIVSSKCDDDDRQGKGRKKGGLTSEEKNSITLSDFLELLDGIVEIPGRMIVMSSNHPEILDPALIRPGRIDKVIEFNKLNKINVAKIFKHWFGHKLPQNVFDSMKDNVFTQAEIGNLFAQRNLDYIYKSLIGSVHN